MDIPIGQRLARWRAHRDMTLAAVGDRAKVSKQALSLIELGEGDITFSRLARVVVALDLDLPTFFGALPDATPAKRRTRRAA